MTPNHEERVQAANWLLKALEDLGVYEIVEPILYIEWSTRMTSALGKAVVMSDLSKVTAKLSVPLWERATEDERYQTVLHEAAHIAVMVTALKEGRVDPPAHGYEWKAAMLKLGLRPEIYHHVDNRDIRRKRVRYGLQCDECERVYWVTKQKLNKVLKRPGYMCHCGGSLKSTGKKREL